MCFVCYSDLILDLAVLVSYQALVRFRWAAVVLVEEFAAQQEKLQALVRVLEIVAEVAEYLVARSIFWVPLPVYLPLV